MTDKPICNRDNCELCQKLNDLGNLLKYKGELTRNVRDKLGECFYH